MFLEINKIKGKAKTIQNDMVALQKFNQSFDAYYEIVSEKAQNCDLEYLLKEKIFL